MRPNRKVIDRTTPYSEIYVPQGCVFHHPNYNFMNSEAFSKNPDANIARNSPYIQFWRENGASGSQVKNGRGKRFWPPVVTPVIYPNQNTSDRGDHI